MKQMRNKKARQIARDFFGEMYDEKRGLFDCYENPSMRKIEIWNSICRIAREKYFGGEVKIYGYNNQKFSVVFYGIVDGVTGIIYISPEKQYIIPDNFIQKVFSEWHRAHPTTGCNVGKEVATPQPLQNKKSRTLQTEKEKDKCKEQ